MDEDFKKICPNCCQLYVLQFSSAKLKGNLPHFLPCGHSMCENCIVNILKCVEPIECKICLSEFEIISGEASELIQNKEKLNKKFPINVQMVGELTVNHMKALNTHIKKAEEENQFIDLKSILKCDVARGNCMECHASTSKMCKQCVSILCDVCFTKTHKNFVIFKNHELQPIGTAMQPSQNCKLHIEKPLDYYCKDCQKAVCMDCLMVGGEKSCKNHDTVPIQEVNETFLEDLIEISPKVDETFRRLTKTAVDVGYLLQNYENDTGSAKELTKILAKVDQHFSKLSFIIQKHKEEIINIILYLKFSEKNSLQKVKSEIANSIKKAITVKNMIANTYDVKNIKQVNLPALLEEAKQIINTPWYLNKNVSNEESLKVTVNEDLCSLVSDYVHLEGNVKSQYKLFPTSEIGDDVDIPAAPNAPVYPPELPKDARLSNKPKVDNEEGKGPSLHKNVPKYRTKSGSVSSLNSNSSDTSFKSYITQNTNYQPKPIVHPVSPFAEGQPPQQLREGSQELIYISHIVDPHNFFVQRTCFQNLVKDMFREFRNAVSFAKPSVNHITPGKTYLAFNKADNMWQRCRVIGVEKGDNDNHRIQVFCFDFGSIETVSIDGLRLLPPPKIQCPFPLAINCSLANCVPITGAWTSDDAFLIQSIIDNKQAVINIRRIIPISNVDFKLECDLITFENGINLAHALVFHERAKMPNPNQSYPSITSLKEKPKLYMSHNDFKSESTEVVTLTHVVSPDKFFVRKHHLQNVYEKLSEDLDQEYSLASNSGVVHLPEIGIVYAVNVEKYRSNGSGCAWARGLVTELPGRGRVRLLLPDTGVTLLAHWSALRYIHQKFTTLRALAAECHLAGITPYNKKWSPSSVALLQKYEDSILELQVEDNRQRNKRTRGSIGVTLYDKTDCENIICINSEMIKYKLAISFGVNVFNKSPIEEQVFTNKSPVVKPKPTKPKTNNVTIMKKDMPKKIDEDDLQAKDKGPLRLEVKVLHYQSPSLIYVSLVHQQKSFNELYEKMQKYYSKNKDQTKNEWKVGDKCCTFCTQSQTWRRATIVELENENVKVFYIDFAFIETVSQTNLKELTSEFAMFGDAAIKCHLCGIMPAVGDEWPSLTKEYLKELLDAYKRVFVTKVGNFKDKSMPIEIWVYHTVQGGALEPNTSEWRCLNKKIIEQGLGVPDKTLNVQNEENSDDPGDTLSFLNITGSVNDWLQLEPIPMAPLKSFESERNSNDNSPSSLLEGEETNPELRRDPMSSNIMYITDWLPPEPLACQEFTAIPTYIDNEGLIYLHDVSQEDTLDLIRKALDVRFKNPDPKVKYQKWSVGEPCVALFFLDNRYYRGRVLEVNKEESTCIIQYVDFGNEETCSFSSLRKSVPLHQIPTQAHKCSLSGIRPIGKQWDRQTLDYIHKSIVEKQCYAKIIGPPVNGVIPIQLKINKLWLNDHLVDFEMAEYIDGRKALITKFAPIENKKSKFQEDVVIESDSGPDYLVIEDALSPTDQLSTAEDSFDITSMKDKDWNQIMQEEGTSHNESYLTYPKDIEENFMCNITVINNIHTLELNVIFDDETTEIYEKMFEDIQNNGTEMPPLNGIYENKACIALFAEDGLWYRASILQYSKAKNKVKVKYIDYGNIEIISVADTREINEEWAKLTPATISAKLFGVSVHPDADIKEISMAYSSVFLDKGPFHVKVVKYEESVPLVEIRNDKDELVYEKLFEDNLFIKCD